MQFSALPASQRCACAGHVTAEAQCSQRKMLYCALERMRHGAIRLVFAILRAPGVSAARFCSEVMLETHPCRKRRSITAPIRVSEGSISCFGLKRVSELLEQHMSSDHTPVWIRLLRLSEAPFVAAYRLRRRGNAAMMAGARVCGEE